MPKADPPPVSSPTKSTRSASPTKVPSASKPRHGKTRGILAIPYSNPSSRSSSTASSPTRSSFPLPVFNGPPPKLSNRSRVAIFDNIRSRSSQSTTGQQPQQIWLAEDVSSSSQSSANPPPELPHTESSTPPSPLPDNDDHFGLADIEVALDDVVLSTMNPENKKEEFEEPTAPEQVFVQPHYLPKLFAAKAPSKLPLHCSNPRCAMPTPSDSSSPHFFQCRQCFGRRILCGPCLTSSHEHLPFHWPEAWMESHSDPSISDYWKPHAPRQFGYFKRTSLQSLGLVVGLGHNGDHCPETHRDDAFGMTVLHTTGQHRITVLPCNCCGKELWEQLLDVDIWPATETKPQTGFTIEVLRHQRCFNLRGKTSLKEYYDALVDLTGAAELKGRISTTYEQFRLAVRQYRILSMHMRAGRRQFTLPLADGELCVKCPACPHPGENLPHDWENDPMKQLHYVRFLGSDGNFKLQRLAKRSSSTPSENSKSFLGDGGFYVPEWLFKHYMSETNISTDEPQGQKKSACTTMAGDPGHMPNGSKSLGVTGVFCVSCRHILICPNGVIDFHKGERYRYADVCFAGPLNRSYAAGLQYFVITYDIACKYGVNFKSCCCNSSCKFILIPEERGDINIIFCVNKFHQESHDEGCAAKNSLNYTKYVGRTCGEGVETIWAKMNWLRYSTREMSAGNRIETLSEHFNDWNWQKLLGLVRATKSAYTRSVQSLDIVIKELGDLKSSLGAETTAELEAEYLSAGGKQFLQDPNRLRWLSQKDLVRQMQVAESKRSSIVHGSLASTKVADVDLICKALNLEAMQARLWQWDRDLAKLSNPAPGLRAQIAELIKQVKAGLEKHYHLLSIVAPQLDPLTQKAKDPFTDVILLPSRLTPEEVEQLGLIKLLTIELQLRIGQAYDLIMELRDALSMQSFWTQHVKSQHSSQGMPTKGRSSLQSSVARVTEAVRAYDTCYQWFALRAPDMAKKFGLQPLQRSDLVLLSAWKDAKGYKRTHSRLPWIWTLRPLTRSDTDIEILADNMVNNSDSSREKSTLEQVVEEWKDEFVRLDFVHATAATERWTEEVRILECDMPATCLSLRNTALRWAKRVTEIDVSGVSEGEVRLMCDEQWFATSPDVRGYTVYASHQAALYISIERDALHEFEEVVGKRRWKDIWLPHISQDMDTTN